MCSAIFSHKPSQKDFLNISGTAILFTLLAVLIWQDISLWLGGAICKMAIPVCLVVALIAVLISTHNLRSWLWMLVYFIVTGAICIFTVDNSYDGQCYHQEIIANLMDGWNPFRSPESLDLSEWCLHYPKALEITGASAALFLNSIESGKWVNFLLLYVTFAMAAQFLAMAGIKRRLWIWAVLVTLNPIAICQLPTFYIDYAVYCYLVIAFALVLKAINDPEPGWAYVALVVVTILAIGTKLTSFFYVGLVLFSSIGWTAYRHKWRVTGGIAGIGIAALILGALVFFHPYITNLQNGYHVFYPLMGDGAIDILSVHTPDIYKRIDNRLTNFLISIFYPSFPSTDSRIGAFGIGFGVLFVIALVIFVKQWRHIPISLIYIGCLLLGSVFIFSQSWWGRYVPQTWLFPILVMVCCRLSYPKLTKVMAVLFGVCILSCCPRLVRSAQYTIRQNIFYSSLDDDVEVVEATAQDRRKFEENGIDYKLVRQLSPDRIPVSWIPEIKEVGLTEEDYHRLRNNTPGWLFIEWNTDNENP